MLEVFLDSLKDTAIILPFLFIVFLLIEFIEKSTAKTLKANKILRGGWAPLLGATVGLIPQCGFGVIATKLYSNRFIQIGTLLAVYIATSDEAIPILVANPGAAKALLPVLLVKFLVALLVGFTLNAIANVYEKKHAPAEPESLKIADKTGEIPESECKDEHVHDETHEERVHDETHEEHAHDELRCAEHVHDKDGETENHVHEDCDGKCEVCGHEHCHDHHHAETEDDNDLDECGCCGHHIKGNSKSAKIKDFLLHPLLHTLKVIVVIFIVNMLFGTAIYYLGEERLISFMLADSMFQPFLATLVGLIPNCAASVVVTELYVMGGLSLGSLIGALSVNAGIAYVVLFKENKHPLSNVAIIVGMYLIGSILGLIVCAIQPLF